MNPIVAIVGRPNVGKSTLFNRLVGSRVSIVEGKPRITRDRIYGEVEWLNESFLLVDTGGLHFESGELVKEVKRQTQLAIREADLIYFLVDGREGLTTADHEVAQLLRKSGKPILMVVNKIENQRLWKEESYQFYELGFKEIVPVSAEHGRNTGDLLDMTIEHLPQLSEIEWESDLKVALIGRPNVGKSSLLNSLLGEQRVIVDQVPGTTREAVDTFLEREGLRYQLIDTAGMRKRSKIKDPVEHYSIIRALRAVDRSDLVLFLMDVESGLGKQDKKIADYIIRQGKGLLIAVNKMDLVDDISFFQQLFLRELKARATFLSFAPVIFISALTGYNLHTIWEQLDLLQKEYSREVSTSSLNSVIEDAKQVNQPPISRGRSLKIYYATQVGTSPPRFIFFVNDPVLVKDSYQRYLKNSIRQAFGFTGIPLQFIFRARESRAAKDHESR